MLTGFAAGAAEGVENVSFRPGNAKKLPFADGSFDAVTSNYVYHNVMGADMPCSELLHGFYADDGARCRIRMRKEIKSANTI